MMRLCISVTFEQRWSTIGHERDMPFISSHHCLYSIFRGMGHRTPLDLVLDSLFRFFYSIRVSLVNTNLSMRSIYLTEDIQTIAP